MATVNFSVPDEINARFSATFKGRNKSAILSRLMEQAVEEEEQRKRRVQAIEQLLLLQARTLKATQKGKGTIPGLVTDASIGKARRKGRQ